MLLKDNWDLLNLSQFDPINQKIPLTMIPLSRAHSQWAKIQNFVQKLKITGFYFFLFSQSKIFKGQKNNI